MRDGVPLRVRRGTGALVNRGNALDCSRKLGTGTLRAHAGQVSFPGGRTDPTDADTIRALFTELLGAYGEGAEIRPPFRCDYGYQTRVGAGSFANFGLVALDVAPIMKRPTLSSPAIGRTGALPTPPASLTS